MQLGSMQSSEVVDSIESDESHVGRKKRIYPKCRHGIQQRRCMPCGGTQVHERCKDHNRQITHCIPCGGKRYFNKKCLDHNVRLSYCEPCGGKKKIAKKCLDHGKRLQYCIPCGGSLLVHTKCKHKLRPERCRDCGGEYLCSSCLLTQVSHKGALCSRCNPKAVTRSPVKEASVAAHLAIWASEGLIKTYDRWNKTAADSSTTVCGGFRPDFTWNCSTHAVILEVDEHQHTAYNTKCEFQRMCSLIGAVGEPVRIVRFNTDAFKIAGKTCNIGRSYRLPLLLQRLQHALTTPPTALITVEYVYYSQLTQSQEHIQRFSFQEQSCMAKWIDDLEPRWDEISMASAIEAAVEATTTHTPVDLLQPINRASQTKFEITPATLMSIFYV